MNLKDFPIGKNFPEEVHVIIEIPKGSKNKYEYDPDLEIFKLDRTLHSSVHYPAAYGFVPQTLWHDGDPLDVLVLMSEPVFPGCMVDVRFVGVLHTTDDKGGDEKILAVPSNDPLYNEINSLEDVPQHQLKEIEHFFLTYKDLENKKVVSNGWSNAEKAIDALKESHVMYNNAK